MSERRNSFFINDKLKQKGEKEIRRKASKFFYLVHIFGVEASGLQQGSERAPLHALAGGAYRCGFFPDIICALPEI